MQVPLKFYFIQGPEHSPQGFWDWSPVDSDVPSVLLFSCFEVIFFLQFIIFLVDVWNARKRAFSVDHAKYQWNRRHLHLLSIPGVTPYIHRAFLSYPFSLVLPPPEDIRQQQPSWDPGGSLGGSALRQRNLLKAGWMLSREARYVTPPRVTLVASL